jgi:hypothetical protein
VPTKLNVLAKIAVTGSADITPPTGASRFDDDALILAISGHNDTTHLVPEYKRVLHSILADAALFEPVQIGAA